MRLITGGAYQGKLEYALTISGVQKTEIVDGAVCSEEEMWIKPLINHFHLWIKRMLLEGKNAEEMDQILQQIWTKNPDVIILVDELGCGIVPMEAFDRNYRETTGRLCTRIAKEAEEVHRVICGIGMVIKHA